MKTTWKRIGVLLAAAMLCLGLAAVATGCQSKTADTKQATDWTFTDDAGREVTIPANVTKVVPSGHTANQILLTLCPEKMASVSQKLTDDVLKYIKVDSLKSLPVTGAAFGSKGDLNKETVAGLGDASTMILIDTGEKKDGIKEDLDKLQEQLGITCVFIETKLEDYGTAYEKLGKLTGCTDRAKQLSEYCSNAYKETTDAVAKVTKKNVAYITSGDGVTAIAKGSYQGGVIDLVANNVVQVEKAAGSGTGNTIDMEQLAKWNPEVIIFQSTDTFKKAATDASWKTLSAINNNTYYTVPTSPYNWLNAPPTVNQVMGMQWLPRLLYPSQFKTSITDVTKSYYKTFYNYDMTDAEAKELTANSVVR